MLGRKYSLTCFSPGAAFRATFEFVRLPVSLLLGMAPVLGDVVLDWNALILDAIRADNSPPTLASRNFAILHTAIYDAVNSVERTHQPYRFLLDPAGEASAEAAAVGAAHAVYVILYPSLRAPADELYAKCLASWPTRAAITNGLDLGHLIGLLAIGSRDADGSTTQIPYFPSDAPGQWRRTPPLFRPPLDPHWGLVEPFCLPDIEPFVPHGLPALGSTDYAADVNQAKELGAMNSMIRTPEQSQTAVFWSDFSYTATPPGHWQELASSIALQRANTLGENVRLFALLSLAQADVAIVTWETKYRYNSWRPVTAIRRADEDGNPATEADPAWDSSLAAPPFPEYTSGHSAFSTASATVIANFYGTDAITFTVGSDSLPGVFRTFNSLGACADEIGISRIYGGIHFMSANRDGKALGARVGEHVSQNFLLPNDQLPLLRVEGHAGGVLTLRIHGHNGNTCVLEASGDLANWQPLQTNAAVVGGIAMPDTNANLVEKRFYRVREQ